MTCEIRTADGKRQVGIGDISKNLYKLRNGTHHVNAVVGTKGLCIHEWHRVLGHRDMEVVKRIPSGRLVDGMKIEECKSNCGRDCQVCIKGKMTRLPFPKESM